VLTRRARVRDRTMVPRWSRLGRSGIALTVQPLLVDLEIARSGEQGASRGYASSKLLVWLIR
jgi:hypothetical protein